jgi:capsular exopolysaccharide synthesis family protein
VLAVVATTAGFSLRQDEAFRATSEVLLGRQNLANAVTETAVPTPSGTDFVRYAETQARLAATPDLAAATLRAAGFGDESRDQLLANSTVVADQNADLLVFSVENHRAAAAVRLANAYAGQYVNYRQRLDTATLETARNDLRRRIAQLRRDGQRSSPVYADLLGKEDQLKTLQTLQTSNAAVVRRADTGVQVQPRTLRNVLFALIVGVLLAIGVVFLRESFDRRVRSVEEILDELALPLLGRSPPFQRTGRKTVTPISLDRPGSADAEAFRIVRINLEFAMLSNPLKSLMVTSAITSEGKSTTISNLAVALARAGQSVILVDLDLRRPSVAKQFGLEGRPGLTNAALGQAEIADVIHEIPLRDDEDSDEASSLVRRGGALHVVPSGPLPPVASEFIGSSRLHDILDALGDRCDLLLFDAPPVLGVGDALTLGARVDAMFLVARMDLVTRPMLKELKRTLDAAPQRILGVVASASEDEHGFQYGYGYGYGLPPQDEKPAAAQTY